MEIKGQSGLWPEFWTPEYWRGYRESENIYRRHKLDRDRELAVGLLRPLDGERILEVGCGYSVISQSLLGSAKIRLVGVDLSSSTLEWCRHAFGADVTLCRADAGRLPFKDGSFDAVLCNGVLMHLEDQRLALEEMCRVLRPGGRLGVSGNNALSPFALPVILWTLLKRALLRFRVRQAFRTPWFYLRHLSALGIEVRQMIGDSVLPLGVEVPGVGVSLLPRSLYPVLRVLDRWMDRIPLNWLAYEVWFAGVKVADWGRHGR
jgi:SAM-dependent methyltransferase